jgi:hypothetical protein
MLDFVVELERLVLLSCWSTLTKTHLNDTIKEIQKENIISCKLRSSVRPVARTAPFLSRKIFSAALSAAGNAKPSIP